jgi:hypothetical protein
MSDGAPTLAELQARFQSAVVTGDDAILSLIPANSRTSNEVLLGVYRHAYVARLVEVVRGAYPLLARHMGEPAFTQMAETYVRLYPSRYANARWYAGEVPALLADRAFWHAQELRELAELERALDRAFDAPDAPVLDLAALAAHPPEVWGRLTFRPHPSASLLSFITNAFALWQALKNDAVPPAPKVESEASGYLVWRRGTMPTVRPLAPEERMLWTEAAAGAPFGVLCEMAATYDDPDGAAMRVAQALQEWLGSGLLTEVVT